MNEALGITTLLLPAQPELAAMSSTVMRGLGSWPVGSRLAGPADPERASSTDETGERAVLLISSWFCRL
jgi:hypothetical protein